MEASGNGQIQGETPHAQRDLVVIGASAGGVDALQRLAAGLPPEFPAVILVVLHVPSTGTSVLPQILSRAGALPAAFAEDGLEVQRGAIYVAPADHHMLIHGGRIRLSQGPRENGHRPAVDPLFRSAARAAHSRCIGVVLSGLLDDGASGLRFIHDHGGAAVVQDPEDAAFPGMPEAALALTTADAVVPANELAGVLCGLVDAQLDPALARQHTQEHAGEHDIGGLDRVEIDDPAATALLLDGPPSGLTCPECGGAIWERVDDSGGVRYACHVGHAFTLATLLEEQGRDLEATLWSAVRALEERADVLRRIGRRRSTTRDAVYEHRATEAEAHARALRQILAETGRLAAASPEQS